MLPSLVVSDFSRLNAMRDSREKLSAAWPLRMRQSSELVPLRWTDSGVPSGGTADFSRGPDRLARRQRHRHGLVRLPAGQRRRRGRRRVATGDRLLRPFARMNIASRGGLGLHHASETTGSRCHQAGEVLADLGIGDRLVRKAAGPDAHRDRPKAIRTIPE